MDINALNSPLDLSHSFSQYLKNYLGRPTDFSQANNSYGSMVANPQLFMGPNGQALDPTQSNAAAGVGYLGNRAGAAAANQQQKGSFANLLLQAGQNQANLQNLMTSLTAGQVAGSQGGGGLSMLGL